jgi:hypothetical protein
MQAPAAILKTDAARRRVFGIALVEDVFDLQGDRISGQDIEDAAANTVIAGCAARLQHDGIDRGRLIASFPLTREIADALGIDLPGGRGLWLIGLEFSESAWPAVAEAVRRGAGLSIGGRGIRTPL